jgi:peptide/nickel transport system substrate-binding protein
MKAHRIGYFLLVFALAFTFPTSAWEPTERVRIALTGDESTINPYTYVTGYPGWNLLLLQYDTLFQLDANGVPQPWLVTSAETSDDGLTVTLNLRDDVLWHDGEAFTADDVVFTVNYFKQFVHGRFTRALGSIETAVVSGENSVVLTLSAPAPSLELGTFADVPMLPQHVWSEIESPEAEDAVFSIDVNIGTGPYKLVEYQPNQFYRFEANAAYFAGAPTVQELVFVQYADTTGTVAALQSNEVDMIVGSIPPEQVDLLSMGGEIAVTQGPLFTTDLLIFDLAQAPFNNAVVRRAMSLAINRQDIVDTVFLGAATVGNVGWIHPASVFRNTDVETLYDVDQANVLLDEAGIVDSDGDGIRELDGEPLSFEFLVASDNSLRIRSAELVREMLLQAGIDAQVVVMERTAQVQAVWPDFDVSNGRNYQMAMFGWSAPVQADPIRIATLVHSDPAVGVINLSGYANPVADELSEELLQTIDPNRQQELLSELQAIIAEDLPFIMLAYPDGLYAYRSSVYDGWVFMTGQGVFHKLSFLPPPTG